MGNVVWSTPKSHLAIRWMISCHVACIYTLLFVGNDTVVSCNDLTGLTLGDDDGMDALCFGSHGDDDVVMAGCVADATADYATGKVQ